MFEFRNLPLFRRLILENIERFVYRLDVAQAGGLLIQYAEENGYIGLSLYNQAFATRNSAMQM